MGPFAAIGIAPSKSHFASRVNIRHNGSWLGALATDQVLVRGPFDRVDGGDLTDRRGAALSSGGIALVGFTVDGEFCNESVGVDGRQQSGENSEERQENGD